MNELEQMCAACTREGTDGLALATVVKVDGSAYRHSGARMLIFSDGRRIGSISGGCLEADVVERARTVVRERHAHSMTFDTRTVEGRLMYDLGCNGAVTILIEPLADPRVSSALAALNQCAQNRRFGVLATVFRADDESHVGDRILITSSDGAIVLNSLAQEDLAAMEEDLCLWSPLYAAESKTYSVGGENIEVLIDSVVPPIQLIIAGAGEDVKPVARLGETLGWQVSIGDPRGSLLTPDRFPPPARLMTGQPSGILAATTLDTLTAVVLMSHNYSLDLEWLEALARVEIPYIGLLGPRRRSRQLLKDLESSGTTIDPERVYSPVGLDIGSEAPAEVALAVVAEIQAVMRSTNGGHLRDRAGALHGSPQAAETDLETPFVRSECPAWR
jgi:xanthine/CO dehydrogenase XdhC/CoxF family maturation factor